MSLGGQARVPITAVASTVLLGLVLRMVLRSTSSQDGRGGSTRSVLRICTVTAFRRLISNRDNNEKVLAGFQDPLERDRLSCRPN